MAATENQLARTRSATARREWRVSIGPPRDQQLDFAFQIGEPVVFPPQTEVQDSMLPGETGINVGDTDGYPTSGTLIIGAETQRPGWWSYTGKTSSTFTGMLLLQGHPLPQEGDSVTAWAALGHFPPLGSSAIQRIDAAPVISETDDGQFETWEASLSGVYFDRRLFRDDATVLIEERVFPEGHIDYATDWTVSAVGYVRRWDVTVDHRRINRWTATVESIKTYLDTTRAPATSYGREELLSGSSVNASAKLASAEDELAEFQGGFGTTDPENAVDENADTLYISQLAPTSVAETPGSSAGSDPGVQVEEVFRGDNRSPRLQWIMLRLAADSPHYTEEGQSLHGFALTNAQTIFADSNVDNWPMELQGGGAQFYVRLHGLSLNMNNDILILTNNGAEFRSRYSVESTVQVVDWRFLDGFGNDVTPSLDFELSLNDWVQLRYCRGKESVRSMVAWNTLPSEPWWNNEYDETESAGVWTDALTVTWTTANTSIRRVPVSLNTNSRTAFDEELNPNPADRRTDSDQVFLSGAIEPFIVNPASAMTNVSPASGANLVLTNASWLDQSGTAKIDAEEIQYRGRDATTLYNITRGANGTTAASHTTAALVYNVGEWIMISQALPQYVSATSPANGENLTLLDTSDLDASGTIRLHDEQINYASKSATQIVNITRAANGTLAAGHVLRTPIYRKDNASLGATRLPLVDSVGWDRWLRKSPAGIPIVPERFVVYGSTEESPLYPGDPDWTVDWTILDEVTGNTATSYRGDISPPRRLRHLLIRCSKMTDNGRFKINSFRAWRKQIDDAPNDEIGAGIVVRDMLERVLPREMITIDGTAFSGTISDMVTSESSVSEVLSDVLEETFTVCRCERDGTVTVFRDPFHPLGARVEVTAVIDPDMMRTGVRTNYPSRLGADQIIVELLNARTLEVYEGRFPPNANAMNIRRISLRRATASQAAADAAAARMYYVQEEISRTFSFVTAGIAEWMHVGQRLLVSDFSDDERPMGFLVNTIVKGVTHGGDGGTEEVTVQELRSL
jgi:hypothetical protein